MFSSPQESSRAHRRCSEPWAPRLRPRSHSLNSAEARSAHHRTVKFLVSDSEDEDGYFEDNEASSAEDARPPVKNRVRPWSAAPKDSVSRVKDLHHGPSAHPCKPNSPQSLRRHRGSSPSAQDCKQPLRAPEKQRSQQVSPLLHSQKNVKRRQRSLGPVGRKYSFNTPAAGAPPPRLQQQRPSSAGPLVRNRPKVPFFLSVNVSEQDISTFVISHYPRCFSVPPLSSGPEHRWLSWGFLWHSSRAVVGSQPGGEGAAWDGHGEGLPSTHSHSGSAEDRLPQPREGGCVMNPDNQ